LPVAVGGERRAALVWAAAGAAGAALGPGIGGLLTELVSWEAIFLVQVPVALALGIALLGATQATGGAPGEPQAAAFTRRPHLAANLALGLVSAALAAALFLVVLLMIEGWRLSPIAAAAAVTVMPAAALLGGRLAGDVSDPATRAVAGVVLIAGGLAGLGLLPEATVALTFPPQVLVGVGLALTLSALTEAALAGRAPQAIHGGWTIAARHAGVVAGLLLLTPVFTADLVEQRADARQAGTAALLDASIPIPLKVELTERLTERLDAERGRVPVVAPAFEPLPDDPEERAGALALRASLEDELDRAATHAFSASFLLAAALGLAALLPIGLGRRSVTL
jgi:hypothetical protein